MTGHPRPTSAAEAGARRALVVRFLIVHTFAYAVAFPWAIAALPVIFAWRERELLAMAHERDAVLLVLQWAALPALAALLVAHALGVPWIHAARGGSRRGLTLFSAGSGVLTALGVAAAIAAWVVVLGR